MDEEACEMVLKAAFSVSLYCDMTFSPGFKAVRKGLRLAFCSYFAVTVA